jgi:molybdopterin-guanine dinucleotide biosynthesis protein A
MAILGAILAGGKSRRFGSDKALVPIDGRPMLDHVVAALAPQVDALAICGREWPGLLTLPDHPLPGIGPLAGLCAALDHAVRNGFEAVLSVPVDVLPIPGDLRDLLSGNGPAVFERQYLVGWWPAACRDALEEHILSGGSHAFRAWLDLSGARTVVEPVAMFNINRVEDFRSAFAKEN